ncbi:hypothetical protein M0K47_004980 [Escherichia coli]|nr:MULTISPECIES: hypothetical protein [Escherichia]EGS5160194.1 hypothetical protein [Escherichia coli]EIU7773807.1 hypothetical protein [Salmonella enterica]EJM5548044.1 hypothetical protein [Salmonella enterica]EKX8151904.1 hypothetical protein [Escherichia coli]HAX4579557.1 hypothetical protein [Escherichia coli]
MLGFVSALSSAVAVMILIMTTLLINLGTTMLARDNALKSIQIDKLSSSQHSQNDMKKTQGDILFGGLSLSAVDLKKIKESGVSTLVIYCQYGSNLSKSVATKISTLNYLRLKKYLGDKTEVILLSPPNTETTNSCYVEVKND